MFQVACGAGNAGAYCNALGERLQIGLRAVGRRQVGKVGSAVRGGCLKAARQKKGLARGKPEEKRNGMRLR
ncbi:hypothetical protein A7Q00_03210 [Eikenella halliae]|uniref:Uncharacterized protein n=1 Tax=Eikenella halliae TaxID=1795832 RepID=A0A1B6W0V7_9NEIS|nr:hypothetical protein A7Q00_03210 [Eikenella halliae]